jgi:hypothetical protein
MQTFCPPQAKYEPNRYSDPIVWPHITAGALIFSPQTVHDLQQGLTVVCSPHTIEAILWRYLSSFYGINDLGHSRHATYFVDVTGFDASISQCLLGWLHALYKW